MRQRGGIRMLLTVYVWVAQEHLDLQAEVAAAGVLVGGWMCWVGGCAGWVHASPAGCLWLRDFIVQGPQWPHMRA